MCSFYRIPQIHQSAEKRFPFPVFGDERGLGWRGSTIGLIGKRNKTVCGRVRFGSLVELDAHFQLIKFGIAWWIRPKVTLSEWVSSFWQETCSCGLNDCSLLLRIISILF